MKSCFLKMLNDNDNLITFIYIYIYILIHESYKQTECMLPNMTNGARNQSGIKKSLRKWHEPFHRDSHF